MNTEILWLFVHLPKTGGTTFNEHLYKYWGKNEQVYRIYSRGQFDTKLRQGFSEIPLKQRNKAQALVGHHLYYGVHKLVSGKEPRYITFLRDPAERCISQYNYQYHRGKTQYEFSRWYKDYSLRSMVQFYAERLMNMQLPLNPVNNFSLAQKFLDLCWYVGIQERLDFDLSTIFSQMGLPASWVNYKVAGQGAQAPEELFKKSSKMIQKRFHLDEEMRQQIYHDHPMDLQLYKYALRSNEVALKEMNG